MSASLSSTKRYEMFELLEFNRDIGKTKKLEESMKTHGFLPAYPLHCVKNGNGKLKVKAGHHRLTVAIKLGLPVYYVICNDSASIHELEGGTTPWKVKDYLTSFCRCGHTDYQVVKEYIDRTGINLQSAVSMLGGQSAGSNNLMPAFKAGLFKVKDNNHAELVADIIQHCDDAGFRFAKCKLFVIAISRTVIASGFDSEQFKRRVTTNAATMQKQPHLAGYMDLIESTYNRNSKSKIPLVFLARQAAQDRLPSQLRTKTT